MLKLQFKDSPERSIWLVGDKVTIGSNADSTIILTGLGVNGCHAEIHINGNTLHLQAEPGSCMVNDLPVDDGCALLPDDELRIGHNVLTVIDPKAALTSAASEPRDAASAAVGTAWSLLPDHPKLKPEDFAIQPYTVIGRSTDCQFTVPYKLLSREHAALIVEDDQLTVKDLGSANGCFVNGERVTEAVLKNGDKLAFAKLGFTVQGPERAAVMESSEALAVDGTTSDSKQMNITMMRPAVKLDELPIAEAPVELDDGDAAESMASSLEADKPAVVAKSKRWPLILLVLAVTVAAGWYMLGLA